MTKYFTEKMQFFAKKVLFSRKFMVMGCILRLQLRGNGTESSEVTGGVRRYCSVAKCEGASPKLTKYFTEKCIFLLFFHKKRDFCAPLYIFFAIFIYLCVFPIASRLPPSNHPHLAQKYHILFVQTTLRHILLRARAFPY